MKSKFSLIFLFFIGSINLHAQTIVLVDSIMLDTSRSVDYILSKDNSATSPRALISYVTGNDNPHEVIYKGKIILKLPPASLLYYINDTMMLVEKYEKDDKYWRYGRLVRYGIGDDGSITFQDSISLGESEIGVLCNGFLPKRPLVVTYDGVAVEGGGCNYAFNIYDENLKVIKSIVPFTGDGCGNNSSVYVQNDELNFVDVDATDESHVFYCSMNYMTMEIKTMNRIRIDTNFHIFTGFHLKGNLYLSGYKKLSAGPPKNFPLMVFNTKGELLHTNKLQSTVESMMSHPNGNVYWLDSYSNFYVNGKKTPNFKGYHFDGEFITTYPNPKTYIYEIK
jgi:hypothetical protein